MKELINKHIEGTTTKLGRGRIDLCCCFKLHIYNTALPALNHQDALCDQTSWFSFSFDFKFPCGNLVAEQFEPFCQNFQSHKVKFSQFNST